MNQEAVLAQSVREVLGCLGRRSMMPRQSAWRSIRGEPIARRIAQPDDPLEDQPDPLSSFLHLPEEAFAYRRLSGSTAPDDPGFPADPLCAHERSSRLHYAGADQNRPQDRGILSRGDVPLLGPLRPDETAAPHWSMPFIFCRMRSRFDSPNRPIF